MKIKIHSARRFRRVVSGFTLIELLTAMAVLAMVMVLLLQVTDGILRSTRLQSQQMDSTGAARRALDILALDLSCAVVGESAAILASSSPTAKLALITDRRGTNTADHRFLAVTYQLAANKLVRTYRSVSFAETDLLIASADTNNSAESTLADGILGLNIRVATSSGIEPIGNASAANYLTGNYNGFSVPANWLALITRSPKFASGLTNRAQSLDIWIAAVDDQNKELLNATEKLKAAKNALGNNPAQWRSEIDNANLPLPAKSAIQVLNKNIPMP